MAEVTRLPPIGTLTDRADFLRLGRSRHKWVTPGMIVQAAPRDEAGRDDRPPAPVRVGFTASRRVGNAVARNRAKRRLRAAVRTVVPELGKPGWDYVLIARPATVARGYEDLLQDLRSALKRLPTRTRNRTQAARRTGATAPD